MTRCCAPHPTPEGRGKLFGGVGCRPTRNPEEPFFKSGLFTLPRRFLPVPLPGRLDDGRQILLTRLPAKLAADARGVGHQHRRVTGPARGYGFGNGVAGPGPGGPGPPPPPHGAAGGAVCYT